MTDSTEPTQPIGEADTTNPASASAEQAPEGAVKPQRPATLTFTQAVLGLQALAALFATLVTWGLSRTTEVSLTAGWIWAGGAVLMVALFYVAGKQKQRWGRVAGWILQIPMIAAGVILPAIAVIGVMFLVLWIMGLRIGGRIDRERAERIEAQGEATVGGTRDGEDADATGE
ncbi:DUF4233 domain-containing protein [Demequina oxidasica]|uniref:DUF4233 domain-containing protein n=1 Tax=Demequina oxidasica TaxID=676199 RepID=UPI000780F717|nr:DUF4233 domain-containing protein [Demequina oxidasica]